MSNQNYAAAVNLGLGGTGAIVAGAGADQVGQAIQYAAPGVGGATLAGLEGRWGTMVTQGMQGAGGAVQVANANVGQQLTGYGTALGNATQYGLDTESAANGLIQGITNAGIVAQGGDVNQVVPGTIPVVSNGVV